MHTYICLYREVCLSCGGSCPGVLSGVFCLEGFVRGGFCPSPILSEYICYDTKLNITLNFMFHMYDKKIISVTTTPTLVTKLSHLLGPPSSVTYFMDGPFIPPTHSF